jgi:hypothetical protein
VPGRLVPVVELGVGVWGAAFGCPVEHGREWIEVGGAARVLAYPGAGEAPRRFPWELSLMPVTLRDRVLIVFCCE